MFAVIVTIDGPAAAGKSTVARLLAEQLDFDYLDTGATYRAVTWKAVEENADFHDPKQLAQLARNTDIRFITDNGEQRIQCDGMDVTDKIRDPKVTEKIHYLADEPEVRRALINIQRDYARGRNIVTEGRDQGTDVFPDAEVKIYLDASAKTRARRRHKEMQAKGVAKEFEDVLAAIHKRDQQDKNRRMGGLKLKDDMIVVDSTDLTAKEVVNKIKDIVCEHPAFKTPCGQANA